MGYFLLIIIGLVFLMWLFAQIYNFFDPHASERWEHEREEYNNVVKLDNSHSLVTNEKEYYNDNTYLAKYYPTIHYSISFERSWIRFKYVLSEKVEYISIESWILYNGSYRYDQTQSGIQHKPNQKPCYINLLVDTMFTRGLMVFIIVKPIGKQPYKYKEVFKV